MPRERFGHGLDQGEVGVGAAGGLGEIGDEGERTVGRGGDGGHGCNEPAVAPKYR
jgi:hypothetical protein